MSSCIAWWTARERKFVYEYMHISWRSIVPDIGIVAAAKTVYFTLMLSHLCNLNAFIDGRRRYRHSSALFKCLVHNAHHTRPISVPLARAFVLVPLWTRGSDIYYVPIHRFIVPEWWCAPGQNLIHIIIWYLSGKRTELRMDDYFEVMQGASSTSLCI